MANQHKYSSILIIALLFFAGGHSDAASWRINNNANRHAHFTDINAAMNSSEVQDGDTLYLDPGCLLTSTQNITKRVTIIGTGYFLGANTHQEASVSGSVYLKAASTKVEGLKMTGKVYMSANNVTVERCYLGGVGYSGTAQYATIRQCYVPNGQIGGKGNTDTATANWTIENCIIIRTDGYDPIINLYCPTIRNNYVRPNYSSASAAVAHVSGATIINNIFINTRFIGNAELYDASDCIVKNNIFHVASYKTTYPGNVIIDTNTESAVFALTGTNEQRYTLKEDSPAKGAATDGGDCGPYGGIYPYVLSGYPLGMPRFDSSNVGTRAVDGQVRVSQQVTIQGQ